MVNSYNDQKISEQEILPEKREPFYNNIDAQGPMYHEG